nr:protein kinase [Planctomycetota bacterium]
MNDAKFARAGNIYLRAIQVSMEQREQFLTDQCGDAECRELVESMLQADAESIVQRGGSSDDSKSMADAFEETFIQPVETIQRISEESSIATPAALGRYEIKGVLGQGAFGRVFLGRDSQLDRDVAIKLPRGSMKKQEFVSFLQEARRVAQLRHPGIVAVFDVGEFEERVFIVSDYISGTTLSKWIQQTNYTWQRAAAIVADVADALGHAHSQGIMHRDVKPANVMMTISGQPVLLDFGLALSTAEGGETPGLVAGTPQYMSPEQALGQAHRVDGRTDLYALGVVFYQMLCGQMPFAARSTHELLRRITEDAPQPLRQIDERLPPEVESICLKAMSREMADRHSTMADFAQELRDAIAASPEAESAQPAGGEEPTVDFAPQPASPGAAGLGSLAEPGEGSSMRVDSRIHDSERRQVTALYCDIDDAGADLDPEELHWIVTAVQSIAIRIGEEFGGHIGRQSVEGLMIYFGYPNSYEDAVFRAVRAGRDLITEAEPMFEQLDMPDDIRPSLRVGMHTGLVVTEETREPGDSVSTTVNIVGNVSRVATGVAVHAESNGLIISETVHRIAGGSFECQSIGAHRIKGLRREVELFSVLAERDDQATAPNLSTLIGREHELGILSECWRQASGGNSQVVLVGAEAGVGKSRLFEAFVETLSGQEVTTLFGRGSAYHAGSALWPVAQILGQLPGVGASGEADAKLAALESLADRFELPRDGCIPFLAGQLGLSTEDRYAPFEGTPERRKQRTLESIVDVVLGLADEEPLLFVVEDLHWIDATTVELISALIGESSASQIMLVLTYRPSFSPPWTMQTDVSQFTLGNLHAIETRRLAEFVAGKPIPNEVAEHIVKRTDGVPLYVEEMMKAVLEAGVLEEDRGQFVLAGPLDTLP